ncbi:bifunctional 2-C-methyl-D-erythritol 4-phosphate cytidylyltransferase/2-C-methyl-D-erythritol 2,4-cyclodiphosphate synthase [Tistrella sp. BH-R2-4]|uniref:Bifunctional enzyme IspD/IspF n=1 Tax=Tistrella arctica TaxID=3133430 RepID=A0ABU9YEW1_9PROT
MTATLSDATSANADPADPASAVRPRVAALIVAAGRGRRFGTAVPKQYQALDGQAVLCHPMRAFLNHPRIDRVQVVIGADDQVLYDLATDGLAPRSGKLAPAVIGGAERQASVRLGLEALAAAGGIDLVLVHDAARPFVPAAMIDRVIDALGDAPAALPALPVTDTLKRAIDAAADGAALVAGTMARDGLWRAQTPQGARLDLLLAAHHAVAGRALTDDAAVMEAAGHAVRLVTGSETAFKITTADDFDRARQMLAASGGRPAATLLPATGTGFDVHGFGPGNHVWLCGVAVPHSHGLNGHSDADVALHALTDAVLGAIAADDIGRHFPPSDPRWKGASSDRFLVHALALMGAMGGRLVHCDVTIIGERPKIGPHRAAMRARLADLTGLPPTRIGVKATTTEKLGFTGRGEGLAAMASATVLLPEAGTGAIIWERTP